MQPINDPGGAMSFHPYLNFAGTCREAFTRYQEIFGGELEFMTAEEMPADEDAPPAPPDLVIHAALRLGGDPSQLLMASDAWDVESFPPVQGMYVNITVADVDEAERVFAALSEGGEVEMPIAETFWSPRFGVCRDRFGTPWMIDTEAPAAG
jgi:PhnB protein